MGEFRYLLDVKELEQTDETGELWQRVLRLLDSDRLKKLEKYTQKNARALCAGAGLLLQWAFCAYESEGWRKPGQKEGEAERAPIRLELFRPEELLDQIDGKEDFEIVREENGKPAIKGNPFYFNISHSGKYVFCAVSESEIGADIQEQKKENGDNTGKKELRLAERFFAEQEFRELKKYGKEAEAIKKFYYLWTRKEAVGKLHGDGLMKWIGRNMQNGLSEEGKRYLWEEYEMENYLIAVCRFFEGSKA